VLTYWAIVGMYLALHYSNMRTSLAEARLAALRAQLNPHFLFNTLNAISTLALKGDQPAVTETIGRLSGLLRAALDEHTEEISLTREMEFLDDYVAIQQIRFADRLCVEKRIAPDTGDGLVPTMILQPIVENAIKHGVNAQRGSGHVDISAVRNNGSLIIEVRDSGPGFRAATASGWRTPARVSSSCTDRTIASSTAACRRVAHRCGLPSRSTIARREIRW
jgi:two-component system LytT family sensor kinase